MKIILAGLLACACLAGATHAGDFSNTVGWGHTPSGNTGRSTNLFNYGAIAGQNEDAKFGNLSSRPTYNTNYAIGNWNQIDIHGNGNTVNNGSINTGNVTAGQTNGGGGIKQTIGQ